MDAELPNMKKFGRDGRTPGPPGEEVWIRLT